MTATPERPTSTAPHADGDESATGWANRSLFDTRGIPWWWAVLLAVVPTALGTLVDVLIWSKPGLVFTCCYALGSLLAVALVRRASLFGPMVQPPLVLAIIMPLVVLLAGVGMPSGGGATAVVLAVVSPLISGFPAMAITTALALGIGLLRVFVLERSRPRKGKPPTEDSDAPTKIAPRPPKKPAETDRKRPEDRQRAPGRGQGRRRPASGAESEQRSGRGGRASGRSRPAEGGEPAKRAPNKQRPKQGADQGKQGTPGKQGARPRGPAPSGDRQRDPQQGAQRQGKQQGRPAPGARPRGEGKPQRGEQPPPGKGTGPRQAPPGRGGKPPQQRPSGDQPGRPRRPRRDNG